MSNITLFETKFVNFSKEKKNPQLVLKELVSNFVPLSLSYI